MRIKKTKDFMSRYYEYEKAERESTISPLQEKLSEIICFTNFLSHMFVPFKDTEAGE